MRCFLLIVKSGEDLEPGDWVKHFLAVWHNCIIRDEVSKSLFSKSLPSPFTYQMLTILSVDGKGLMCVKTVWYSV